MNAAVGLRKGSCEFGSERRALRVTNLPMTPANPGPPRIFASIFDVPEVEEPDIGAELQRIINDALG